MKKPKGEQLDRIKKHIVGKLYASDRWENGHFLEHILGEGLPKHERGYVSYALKELISEGLIKIYGQTKRGTAYQLNKYKKSEIESMLGVQH